MAFKCKRILPDNSNISVSVGWKLRAINTDSMALLFYKTNNILSSLTQELITLNAEIARFLFFA